MKGLELRLLNIIDEVFIATAEGKLSSNSNLFKACALAKKILAQNDDFIIDTYTRTNANSMFSHILSVLYYINEKNLSFSEACARVAKETNLKNPSIRQATCRNLKLDANIWNSYVNKNQESKNLIKEKLLWRYPNEKERYIKYFL